jgi:hypothetical protein
LLSATGSLVLADTLARFTSDPPVAGARTTTLTVGAVAPFARSERVQVTVALPDAVQAQPVPAADRKVTPAGSVSTSTTDRAVSGPALDTVSA